MTHDDPKPMEKSGSAYWLRWREPEGSEPVPHKQSTELWATQVDLEEIPSGKLT